MRKVRVAARFFLHKDLDAFDVHGSALTHVGGIRPVEALHRAEQSRRGAEDSGEDDVVVVVSDLVRRLDRFEREAAEPGCTGREGDPAEDFGVVATVQAVLFHPGLKPLGVHIPLASLDPVAAGARLELGHRDGIGYRRGERDGDPVKPALVPARVATVRRYAQLSSAAQPTCRGPCLHGPDAAVLHY